MTAQRWAQMKEIFGAALEMPEAERRTYLDSACGGDAELRGEIERLLAEERKPDFRSPVSGMLRQPSAPSKGDMLGRYRIEEKLGEGGMGVVYRAHDTRLNRDVAIKVLPRDLVADPGRKRRFAQEAKAASALDHPGIVTIYDIDTADGVDFIAMEYIQGRTLDQLIGHKAMRLSEVLDVAIQIADALARAHSAGIVHRDLKPANVMVTPDGLVKILDFGLAKLSEISTDSSDAAVTATIGFTHEPRTGEGIVVGTVAYMSPEQARGEEVDARTDLFSFGAVLYEMATGKRAFSGATTAVIHDAILNRAPASPLELNPDLPRRLEEIIGKAIEKDRDVRYQAASELRSDLKRLKRDIETGQPVAASLLPQTGRGRARPPRRREAVMALSGVLLVAAALAVGLNLGGARDRLLKTLGARPPKINSLAVLPLANLSGDAQQEYFADGMTEALTSNLAKLGGLRVISRTSAMNFKGTHKPLKEIAKALGVDAVVEGSVLRWGGRVRIAAQLIEAATDTHLWSETYERDLQDVLRLQSEVAQAIAREIKVAVTPEEQQRLTSARTVKPEAYETYLKAMFFVNKFTPEGFEKGMAYLQQAVDKDPSDPFAYAALGLGYAIIGHERFPEALPRGKAAARRSLELGGPVPEAYLALAMAELYADWDYAAGGRDLRRVLEISPNLAEARRHYSWYLRVLGRKNEGLAEMKRAAELEPLTPLFTADYAWQLAEDGQNDAALEQAQKSLEVNPKFAAALAVAGFAYLAKGMNEQAVEVHRKAAEADAEWRWPLAETYAHLGQKNEARKIAAEIGKKAGPMDQWALGRVYTALGEKDQAFRWLEAAYQSRFSWMPWTVNDPASGFAPLFGDPRFKDLARRVGAPPAGL